VPAVAEAIRKLLSGADLETGEAHACFEEIMDGRAGEAQLAAFLVALRMKGETAEEIAAFASAMREKARKVPTRRQDLLDTCGTGGDSRGGFNVSTVAALVAAGADAAVAKHGNRAVSSRCGSADLLEHLGVRIDCDEAAVGRCLDEAGIGFLFAPSMHPAMLHAAGVRRALGVRTVFNLLGPLTHPMSVRFQLLGVFEKRWVEPVARALRALGADRALIVHGLDGMDEITTTGPTAVAELDGGAIREFQLDARDLGFPRADPDDLRGGDPADNAAIARSILENRPGPRRDLVLVNSGAAIWAARGATTLAEGVARAAESLESGAAAAKLDALIRLTGAPAGKERG
jgi:anthranilate phosphoribosyltransferase